jgi:predicted O-methyltransferase YrrM
MAELTGEATALERCRAIKGWLEEDEARMLYKHASELGPIGPLLEIGSFHGKSTVVLGLAAKSVGTRVVAVDPHEGINYRQGDIPPLPHLGGPSFDSFQANLQAAGVEDVVEALVMSSIEAFGVTRDRDSFSFVFVDGNHGYEHVRQDFDLWSQRLIPGGVIAFHDANGKMPGPPRVVAEVRERADFEFLSLVEQLASFRKVA